MNASAAEATKYVPEQWKAVADALAAAKDSFNEGDYRSALSRARCPPEGEARGGGGGEKGSAREGVERHERRRSGMVEALKSRFDMLSSSRASGRFG